MQRTSVDGGQAYLGVVKSKYRQWRASEKDSDNAGSRFKDGGFFVVQHRPRFTLSPDDAVFTIGSCFARNVEERLVSRGVNVVTSTFSLPPERYQTVSRPNAALNKYSTASILSQLDDVLTGNTAPEATMIDMGDDRWFDPFASLTKPADLKTALETRALITDVTKKITSSDVVFITLGLTETWIDNQTGLILNVTPPYNLVRRSPGRFAWFNSSYAESLENMERTLALIWKHCRSDMRIVVTVSPVPVNSTFSDLDIVVANTYSKSVLRAIAQALVERYPLVDYFPSYEMAINSPRDITWEADQIHVTNEAVAAIIGHFTEIYMPASAKTLPPIKNASV